MIGDKVWIGCNCTILKGVTIGENSVVAANSFDTGMCRQILWKWAKSARVIKTNINWFTDSLCCWIWISQAACSVLVRFTCKRSDIQVTLFFFNWGVFEDIIIHKDFVA